MSSICAIGLMSGTSYDGVDVALLNTDGEGIDRVGPTGYRPYSEQRHVAVIEFVHELFGKEISDKMINIFDRMRKKRHRIVYEEAGIVTQDEAEQAIRWAEEFVQKTQTLLARK